MDELAGHRPLEPLGGTGTRIIRDFFAGLPCVFVEWAPQLAAIDALPGAGT